MEVQSLLSLFCFLFAKCKSTGSKVITDKTSCVSAFCLSAYLYFSVEFCFCVVISSCISSLKRTSQENKQNHKFSVCPQTRVQHHPAPRCWRRTVSSSTSCPTSAAPGSRPPATRPRHRGPWPPCGPKAPSPSPSPCTSPVGQTAPSGQPATCCMLRPGQFTYFIPV